VAPGDQAVVTVGVFRAGTQSNIIPETAHLEGTIRSRDEGVRKHVGEAVSRICTQVAQAHRTEARVEVAPGCPLVRNSAEMLEIVRRVGQRVLGPQAVHEFEEITMGGEDFAFYLEDNGGVPGAIFRLGIETTAPGHGPRFDFGHKALVPGMRMMAGVAVEFLLGS
jgi:hippurate hydrolase